MHLAPSADVDAAHTPTDHPRWRESYYFSFFDQALGIGGFSSIGKRPAKGYSGSINAVWGPEIPTYVASERGRFDEHGDEFAVAGLTYAKQEPLGRWRLRFDGWLNDGGRARDCDLAAVTQTERFGGGRVRVSYDLTFTPTSPAYVYGVRPEWDGLFDGHVDEIGRMTGVVVLDGHEHEVDARGSKDHSWGVRDWSKPTAWRWLDLLCEGGPEVALWRAKFEGPDWIQDGASYDGATTAALSAYREKLTTERRDGLDRPRYYDFTVRSDTVEIQAKGDVVRVIPLVFANGDGAGGEAMWNDRSLVRCVTEDGRVGWAGAEFQTQTGTAGHA
ncbi:MAG: hypothetical protein JWQ18_588 [Conexibacter sp.]|nr:hypothetical protein [Conexibacter sp.]